MTNAIATATPVPQFIRKEIEVPVETLREIGLPTLSPIRLPVDVPVQPPADEVAKRSREAVSKVIGTAAVAGSSAAVAYVLGTGAIDAGVLQQFPANLTLATGVTAALATASGVYSLSMLRQAAANALQIPRLGLGLQAPQWLLETASRLRVGVKTAATFVSAGVAGASLAIGTSTVGAALMGSGAALSEPRTWIAAGVGALAAVGTFLFGRATVNAAKALAAQAGEEVEGHLVTATIEAFKEQVAEAQAEIARAQAS